MDNNDNNIIFNQEYQIDLNDQNYLSTIQNMLNDLEYFGTNLENVNQLGDNSNSQNNPSRYIIEFELNIQNPNEIIEDIPNYFKNVKHINDILGKPKYIHKKDECIEKDCLICLEKFEYKKYKRILPCCKNIYHKTCIDKWFKKNSSCPNCRYDFLEKKEENQENDDDNY